MDITEILTFINAKRSEGCQCGDTFFEATEPLIWDDDLAVAAAGHVKDMIVNDFFAHKSPEGERAVDRVMEVTDKFKGIRENIARGPGSEIEVMLGWAESPRHCANMMHRNATHLGVAMRLGSEVDNRHGITRPYWAMKLGSGVRETDKATPKAVTGIPKAGKGIAFLELDGDAVIEILSRVREEGAYCGEDAEQKHASDRAIDWHDDIAQAAREQAKKLAENNEEVVRGDERQLKRTWIRGDEFRIGHYMYETASFDFEDALAKWLSDAYSCRRMMARSITFVGVAAAVSYNSVDRKAEEETRVYWVFMYVISTPESMKDEIASYFAGSDITVYGRNNCGRTKRLHRELDGFGVEHYHKFFESNSGQHPNRDKMHHAAAMAERTIGNGRTLPYVIVDNTLYTGFGSAASLYRAVQGLE